MEIKAGMWDAKDPATPVLLKPMLEDTHGPLDKCSDLEKEAVEKAEKYLVKVMADYNECGTPPLSMGDAEEYSNHFINGYLSAKTGKITYGLQEGG